MSGTISSVKSFDLFDTLIARFPVHPHNVFHLIEEQSGIKDFADARVKAEAELFTSEYTFEDIYNRISDYDDRFKDNIELLMDLELQIEYRLIYGIKEKVCTVSPIDIIISDMYLPLSFIKRLISEKTSLVFNGLFLSTHGKRNGSVWPELKKNFDIRMHYGDNPETDIASAGRANIPTTLVTIANRTSHEIILADYGFENISNVIREARLSTFNCDDGVRQAQILQIQLNFPLLFLCSAVLIKIVHDYKYKIVLMSGRDCYLWSTLFRIMLPWADINGVDVKYFMTSRVSRANASDSYVEYFNQLREDGKSLVVDLCGTGWSMSRLLDRAGIADTDLYLMHQLTLPELQKRYAAATGKSDACFQSKYLLNNVAVDNNLLELLNTAAHPMVEDVVKAGRAFLPKYSPFNRTSKGREIVEAQADAFREATQVGIKRIFQDATSRYNDLAANPNLVPAIKELYQGLTKFSQVMLPVREHHEKEEHRVWEILQKPDQG